MGVGVGSMFTCSWSCSDSPERFPSCPWGQHTGSPYPESLSLPGPRSAHVPHGHLVLTSHDFAYTTYVVSGSVCLLLSLFGKWYPGG